MRAIALKRMSRAYVVPKQPDVPYPLEELVNSLVFNDEESVRTLWIEWILLMCTSTSV